MGVWQRPSAWLALLAAAGVMHACVVDYDALAGGDGDDGGATSTGGAEGEGGSNLGGEAGSTGGLELGGTGGQLTGGQGGAQAGGAGSAGLPGGSAGVAGVSGGGGEALAGSAGGPAGAGGADGGTSGVAGMAGVAGVAGVAGAAGVAGSSGAGLTGGGGMGVGGTGGALGGAGGTGGVGGTGGAIGGTAGVGGVAPWPPPSCEGGLDCGGVDCCQTLTVPGGTFPMGRSETGGTDAYTGSGVGSDEVPEHAVAVSTFRLDKFEVTVARFRRFFAAYSLGERPAAGHGAHPQIPGSGWDTQWNVYLPDAVTLEDRLVCDPSFAWWHPTTGNDTLPVNCISWYVAFAFCIWDGGRLPTEAEWEYAAAGGNLNQLFPWGSDPPGTTYAFFDGEFAPVGSRTLGDGWFGHSDIAGNMSEWVLDYHDANWYSGGGNSCTDCANAFSAVPSATRVLRGGGISSTTEGELRAASRDDRDPNAFHYASGIRCARNPL